MLRYCSRFPCLVEDAAPCAVIMVETFVSYTTMQLLLSCRLRPGNLSIAAASAFSLVLSPRAAVQFREGDAVEGGVCRRGLGAEMYSNHPSF